MARIVIIEDDSDLSEAISYNLRKAGHEAITATTGASGLRMAIEHPPDLVLLDLGLPDLSGLELCNMLHERPPTQGVPIVIVSARTSEKHRVAGFEAGASDYLTKPFSMRELMLRIETILRRPRPRHPARQLAVGPIVVDGGTNQAWVNGEELQLARIELLLLRVLVDRRGTVCSRDLLLREVWGLPPGTETRTVDSHVKRLRKKLGAAGSIIETIRGVGYRILDDGDDG